MGWYPIHLDYYYWKCETKLIKLGSISPNLLLGNCDAPESHPIFWHNSVYISWPSSVLIVLKLNKQWPTFEVAQ